MDSSGGAFQVNHFNHSAQGSASAGEGASEFPAEGALRGLIFRAQTLANEVLPVTGLEHFSASPDSPDTPGFLFAHKNHGEVEG